VGEMPCELHSRVLTSVPGEFGAATAQEKTIKPDLIVGKPRGSSMSVKEELKRKFVGQTGFVRGV